MTQAFNLSQLANNVDTNGDLNAAVGLYNQVPVANGGTGLATIPTGTVLIGAGTSAVSTLSAATAGNVLTANGTAWVSQASSGGTPIVTIYTSPSPWTKSPTLKAIKVTMVSGGGGGGAGSGNTLSTGSGAGGGGGGAGNGYFPAASIPGPLTITVGAGGAAVNAPGPTAGQAGGSGGTSSFGALFSITGGGGGGGTFPGASAGGTAGVCTPSPTIIGKEGYAGSPAPAGSASAGGSSAFYYGDGGAAIQTTGGGTAGPGYGGGGGGARFGSSTGTPTVSASGKAGVIVVEEFY